MPSSVPQDVPKLGFPVAQLVKNPPPMQETLVWVLVQEDPWRRDRLPIPVFLGFPCGSAGKESACNTGDLGSIPGLGRYPGEGKGYPLQYSGLENSMDCIVHGVAKSRTWLSNFHFTSTGFLLKVGRVIGPHLFGGQRRRGTWLRYKGDQIWRVEDSS